MIRVFEGHYDYQSDESAADEKIPVVLYKLFHNNYSKVMDANCQ
jgi:hypothetical protein